MVVLVGILAWVLLPLTSVAFDILPTLRAGRRRVCDIDEHTPSIDDFEVLVPIYGDVKYLENVDYLEAYGSKVLLCTTDQEDERVQSTTSPWPPIATASEDLHDPGARTAC